jgi:hypothetical protein
MNEANGEANVPGRDGCFDPWLEMVPPANLLFPFQNNFVVLCKELAMDIPVIVYILPPVVLAMVVYTYVARSRGMAATKHATVSSLAQRMEMAVVEGDPTLNLYYLSQPNSDYKRSILLKGTPYGRSVEFEFTDGTRKQDYLVLIKTTYTWGCYLVARTAVAFPDFEISLRQPPQYLEPTLVMPELPEVRTGDPAIDQHFRIASRDQRVGPAVLACLRLLVGQQYVHLVGKNGAVMIPMTRYGMPYFVHSAEHYLYALETLASGLEGKVAPTARPIAA